MRKKYIPFLVLSFSFFIAPPSLANPKNVKHDPRHLIDTLPDGRQVFNPLRALKVNSLHQRGITGKGVKVAFIDCFDPAQIKPLMTKGAIHSHALRDRTFLNPDEHLERTSLDALMQNFKNLGISYLTASSEEERSRIQERLDYTCLSICKKKELTFINQVKETVENSPNMMAEYELPTFMLQQFNQLAPKMMAKYELSTLMLQQFNKLAPKAKIFPLDFTTLNTTWEIYGETDPETHEVLPKIAMRPTISFAKALRKAFDYHVDAIFMGDFCPELASETGYHYTQDDFNALKEARQRGIALIYNGQSNPLNNPRLVSPIKRIFEELEGNGLLLTGPLDYDYWGEEKKELETEELEPSLKNRLILAPHWHSPPSTSRPLKNHEMASAYCMSAFALLKQHAKDRRLSHSTDQLLKILHDASHTLTDFNSTYKVLDIPNALAFAEGKKGKCPSVAPVSNPSKLMPPKSRRGIRKVTKSVPTHTSKTQRAHHSRAPAPSVKKSSPLPSKLKRPTKRKPTAVPLKRQGHASSQRRARSTPRGVGRTRSVSKTKKTTVRRPARRRALLKTRAREVKVRKKQNPRRR